FGHDVRKPIRPVLCLAWEGFAESLGFEDLLNDLLERLGGVLRNLAQPDRLAPFRRDEQDPPQSLGACAYSAHYPSPYDSSYLILRSSIPSTFAIFAAVPIRMSRP